jgi:predicted helicase
MRKARIFYARTDEFWRRGEKYKYLEETEHRGNVAWRELQPDAKHNWLTEGMRDEFEGFVPIGTKGAKASKGEATESIFKLFSNGNDSGRDDWVYNFDSARLLENVKVFTATYNSEVDRWLRAGRPDDVDDFVINDEKRIKWTRNAKRDLRRGRYVEITPTRVRYALYRPFTARFLYTGKIFNKEVALFPQIFPLPETEKENRIIGLTDAGSEKPFMLLISNRTADLHLSGAGCGTQCFPFYTYGEDGSNRRENITDWALEKFRDNYKDKSISKWDIFHYVYGVLHHPVYRERYAANLKRELPRIPFVPKVEAFRGLAAAGARLAEIHVDYEAQPEYPLERIENPEAALDWRVEKMRLSKDKRSILYNDFLTLAGVPLEAFEYRLGNRSALEWVIDQYQVTTDKRSGITNDPNRPEDPQYILRLLGQVIGVSLETVKIVNSLPDLDTRDKM